MNQQLQNFFDEIVLKYRLYNGLFLELPFEGAGKTGAMLATFSRYLQEEVKEGTCPIKIIDRFFAKYGSESDSKTDVLFKMLQFIERQVVLFDALEDAGFPLTKGLTGGGSLEHLKSKTIDHGRVQNFIEQVDRYRIRIVLTAHPTQFYPESVLVISNQLVTAFKENDFKEVQRLLLQMGKTSFKHKQKPTPFQEAESLLWYLENTLYTTVSTIQKELEDAAGEKIPAGIEIGFWPGGDRDGNPFVTAETTLQVANLLKTRILKLYVDETKSLLQKLTFPGIMESLQKIYEKLKKTHLYCQTKLPPEGAIYATPIELLNDLKKLKDLLIERHNALFSEEIKQFIRKIRCFGFHFAAMDMREDSSKTRKKPSEEMLKSIDAIPKIQKANGEIGLCRYIISNTQSAEDVLCMHERLKGIPIDIIPLFETIEDLKSALTIMEELFKNKKYRAHLKKRDESQTIMLGFSDGTKDGGYVTANWEIYKAKMELTAVAEKHGIRVIFFDGRGGPPGRGGGNTHAFYRSLGSRIRHDTTQLTVQGQTIGVSYGTCASAKYNLEQLYTAGLEDLIFPEETNDLNDDQMRLLQKLSDLSKKKYKALKEDPLFVPYLEKMTPLRFYGDLNIGSRPTTRKNTSNFSFKDLRAIPFVGSWSQLKQNIPGFYGIGTALDQLIRKGNEAELKELYSESLFFRTLLNNAMMSLLKTNFLLTLYMSKDPIFGAFWRSLNREAVLARELLLKVSNQQILLEEDPITRESIRLRESIVLPLLIIQQYAMIQMEKEELLYKKMVIKALSANTNASRNSA